MEGFRDGVYSTTDEVRGPGDTNWIHLEDHPYFVDAVEMVQQAQEDYVHEAEDNHIDMNPLIDVCLVLLVFFILATTLSVMQRAMDMPRNQQDNDKPPPVIPPEMLEKFIIVKVEKNAKGDVTYKVNDYETSADTLLRELERKVTTERKTDLVIDVQPGVPFSSYVFVVDMGKEARVSKIMTKATPSQVRNAPRAASGAPTKAPTK